MAERDALEKRIRALLDEAKSRGKYDFLTVFRDPELMGEIVGWLAEPYRGAVDYVAAPEATGFILGSMVASRLGAGFIALRKGEKLPYDKPEILSVLYTDYSKTPKRIELKRGTLCGKDRVLLVDDWMETAETIKACVCLLKETGAQLEGVAVIGGDENPVKRFEEATPLRCIMLDT